MLLSNQPAHSPGKSLKSRIGRKFSYWTLYVADGWNWSNYHEKLFEAVEVQNLLGLLDRTKTKPNEPWNPWRIAVWMCDDMEAQYISKRVVFT